MDMPPANKNYNNVQVQIHIISACVCDTSELEESAATLKVVVTLSQVIMVRSKPASSVIVHTISHMIFSKHYTVSSDCLHTKPVF